MARNKSATRRTARPKPRESLSVALEQCQRAARRGYKTAKANLSETADAVGVAARALDESLARLERSTARTNAVKEELRHQLASVIRELELLQASTEQKLEQKRRRLDRFSITLFGRTMSGKSTLMEILTRGDGRSIGTGAQRTTRDVRIYPWNGLDVTDVPGIAAFDGAKDETLAYEAASQADLVLFLITDDAPQPAEAECLARVRRLGKPIVGICNVKTAMDDPEDLLLFLRNPSKPFDESRLDGLVDQFHAFAERHMPGTPIPFLFTHLRARFLANHPNYSRQRTPLRTASRFDAIEARLIDEVIGRGKYLRVRSFVDSAAAPMAELADALLAFAARNTSSSNVLAGKGQQFREWAKAFRKDVAERIDTLVTREMAGLREEVPGFAEGHYEDSTAGDNWERLVASRGVIEGVHRLQQALTEECQQAITEVARELKSELSLVGTFSADRQITMDRIFNLKKAWNWGVTGLAGGLTLAAVILGSGPLGWAAAAVYVVGWLVSLFIRDRESRARKAREKLSSKLNANISKMEDYLHKSLHKWFKSELLAKQVNILAEDLHSVTQGLAELAAAQRRLAWTLNDRLKVLASVLLKESLTQLRARLARGAVTRAARIPGVGLMLLVAPGKKVGETVRDRLERLLGERVWVVSDSGNEEALLRLAIGPECDAWPIVFDATNRTASASVDDLSASVRMRLPLAQQLTGIHLVRG